MFLTDHPAISGRTVRFGTDLNIRIISRRQQVAGSSSR